MADVPDVIVVYKNARFGMREGLDRLLSPESPWQKPELETLASHLANAIIHDADIARKQPAYVLTDLHALAKLGERRIIYREEALHAIYHLIDDYLKPEREQLYHLGQEGITAVLRKLFPLRLQLQFDIDRLYEILRVAAERGQSITDLEIIRDLIRREQDSRSAPLQMTI